MFLKVDDVHPGRPWEVGVEEALIIAGNKHTNMEATHRKEKQLESCSTFTKIKIDQIWRVVSLVSVKLRILHWLSFLIYC